MNPLDTLQMLQDWIHELDRQQHDLAVNYIKSNSDLLDTNLEEFVRNCPPSCKLEVKKMLLKAGIEVPDTSLKQWDKLLSDYVKTYKIYHEKNFKDYMENACNWITIDTIPEVEETL